MKTICETLATTAPKEAAAEIRARIKELAIMIGYSPKTLSDMLRRKGFRYITESNLRCHLLEANRLTPKIKAFIKRVQDEETPECCKEHSIVGVSDTDTEDLKTQEQLCEFYRERLETALHNDDFHNIKLYSDLHLKTSESIRRNEIHAAKVGLKSGDMMSRDKVEEIMRRAMYGGNSCVNSALTPICEYVAGMSDPAEIYDTLKPAFVGGLVFSGFSKLANIDVPDWFIKCVQESAKDYLGNSEVLWQDDGSPEMTAQTLKKLTKRRN